MLQNIYRYVKSTRSRRTNTNRSLRCEQCGGMTFATTQELADHNRKEHRMG